MSGLLLAEGEVLLEDAKLGVAVVCSGMLTGNFEGAEDLLVTDVADLAGKKFSSGLTGEGMLCKSVKACAENADLEVWPLDLPWLALPEFDIEDAKPWVLVFGTGFGAPAYELKCLILGVTTEETCSGNEASGGSADRFKPTEPACAIAEGARPPCGRVGCGYQACVFPQCGHVTLVETGAMKK